MDMYITAFIAAPRFGGELCGGWVEGRGYVCIYSGVLCLSL